VDTVKQSITPRVSLLKPTNKEYLIAGIFLSSLTLREYETLILITDGFSNSMIHEIMQIEQKTVERHISELYSKLKGAIYTSEGSTEFYGMVNQKTYMARLVNIAAEA